MHKVDRRLFISDQAVAWPSLKKKVKICFDFVVFYLFLYIYLYMLLNLQKKYTGSFLERITKSEVLQI